MLAPGSATGCGWEGLWGAVQSRGKGKKLFTGSREGHRAQGLCDFARREKAEDEPSTTF